MSEPVKNPLKLFYCYAHEDQALRDVLDSHLISLKRQKLIEIWYDGKISAGAEWEKEINKHLSSADIILLLVSVSFLASDYCYGKEMIRALQRHEEGTSRVIPIILRPVDWEDAPFSKLQVLPTEAKPVTKWVDPDDAYEDIAKRLRVVIKELQAARETAGTEVAAFLSATQTPPSPQRTKEEWLNEGNTLYYGKRYEEALLVYEQAIRLDPNYVHPYVNMGHTLRNLKRYEEALLAYERALRLDPNHASAYNGRGIALSNLEQYKEALLAYEQAIHLDPNYQYAYYNKGLALDNLKRYEEAVLAYEQAIRLDPNYASAYNNMAITLNRLGRTTEAEQARKKARELGST